MLGSAAIASALVGYGNYAAGAVEAEVGSLTKSGAHLVIGLIETKY